MEGSTEALTPQLRVLFGLTPYSDESFFGFISRLADWNHVSSRNELYKGIELHDLRNHGFEAAVEDRGHLARRLRLTEDQLGALVARGDPELHRYRKHINLSARRVSPAGLRAAAYHRAAWTLILPFCAESWDVLIDRCPTCEKKLGWQSALRIELCERCGFDLRRAFASRIPEEQRHSLSALAALIDRDLAKRALPKNLPPLLKQCSSFQVFDLAAALARTRASTIDRTRFVKLSPLKKAARLAFGFDVLVDYPASFDDLTSQQNARLPDFFRAAGLHMGSEIRPLFDRLFIEWEPNRHGPTRLRRRRLESGQLTLREAAKELRIENRHVRHLLNQGLLAAPNGRGDKRNCQWLDPAEVWRAADRLGERMSLQEFSQSFHIPTRGAVQLVSMGVLSRNLDPMVTELYPSPQLNRSQATQFVSRLRSACRVPTPDHPTTPLEDVFLGIGGQEKPWGAILCAALNRDIDLYFADHLPEEVHVTKLQVSLPLAYEILAGQRPDLLALPSMAIGEIDDGLMSRVEAERYLNCFPRDLSWLLEEGHLATLSRQDVAALGQKVISSREINWRWRVSPALREGLGKHGIKRTLGPFWSRAAVEAYFSERFPLGRPS